MLRLISDRTLFPDARPTPGTPEARSQVSGSFLFAKAQHCGDEGGRPSWTPAASHLRASAAQRSRREGHDSSVLWPLGQLVWKIFPVSSAGHITHLEEPDRFQAHVVESVGGDRTAPVDKLWKHCGSKVALRRSLASAVAISFQMQSSDRTCRRPPPQLTPTQPQGAPT